MKTSENGRLGEEAGLAARRLLGLPLDQPLDDVLRALERTANVQVFSRPLGNAGLEGACLTTRGQRFILLNSSKPPVRQRFTLAHEYGHIFLEHGTNVDVSVSWASHDPKEVQANYFAAAFLMPKQAIAAAVPDGTEITFDRLVTLATQFGVSAKAMRIRLENLEMIDRSKIKEFDGMIDAKRHTAVRVSQTNDTISATRWSNGRMPPAMTANVVDALRRGLLSEEHAAALLRADADCLNSLRDELELAVE